MIDQRGLARIVDEPAVLNAPAGDGTDIGAFELPLNRPPVAVDDSYSQYGSDALLDVTAANGVLANDSDPDDNTLLATLVSEPSHGTLTMNPDGSFSYQPDDGFVGADSFTYTADDPIADSVAATVTITIREPPDTVIEAGPADGSVINATAAIFNFSSPNSSAATFECRLNDAEFAVCPSPIEYQGLNEGSYTFEVRAVDAAGMLDASPASRSWRVDTTPPDTSIDSGPAQGSLTTATSAQLAFSGTPGDTVSFECRLDDGNFAICLSPKMYASLADGAHTFAVLAIDAAGNVDQTPASRTWHVDANGPTLAPIVNGGEPVYLNQAGVTASPGASDPGGSGVASASCGPISTATAGDHTVECTAVDNLGNTSNVTVHYTVQYKLSAFQAPAANSKYKRGQTVPVRIMLTDNAGLRLTDTAAAALAGNCAVTFSAAGGQTLTPKCMTYDATAHAFTYRWALAKTGTGNATITVSVTYPSPSTTTTTKSEPIKIT